MKMTADKSKTVFSAMFVLAFFLVACSLGNPLGRNAEPTANPNFAGAELGELVTAGAIESGSNAPRDARNNFSTNDPIIYVIAEITRIEAGTSVFARWSRDEEPFEDSPPITADRLYENTYLEFHIEPTGGTTLEPGDYSVQLYINGNPGPSVDFTVQ